jgi:hypothetical protein
MLNSSELEMGQGEAFHGHYQGMISSMGLRGSDIGEQQELRLFFMAINWVPGTKRIPSLTGWVLLSGFPLATCSHGCLVCWAHSRATAWTASPSWTG